MVEPQAKVILWEKTVKEYFKVKQKRALHVAPAGGEIGVA
jgi:hypothetical protein